MSEEQSRHLMVVEFLLSALLLAYLWLGVLAVFGYVVEADIVELAAAFFAITLLSAPYVALGRLALALATRGSKNLCAISAGWWFMATASAGFPIVGIATQVFILATGTRVNDFASACWKGVSVPNDEYGVRAMAANVIEVTSHAIWFAPLLVPLVHVWLERRRRHAP